MQPGTTLDETRYLTAKWSVDERALNRHVWDALRSEIHRLDRSPLRVFEAGAGAGGAFRRFMEALTEVDLVYTALDVNSQHLNHFISQMPVWMDALGFAPLMADSGGLQYTRGKQRVTIQVVQADVTSFVEYPSNQEAFDLLVAQAFLDMFDLETFLPHLLGVLSSGGLFYFPITFDGVTAFLPEIDPVLDRLVEERYHTSMDERAASHDVSPRSRTGRFLIPQLRKMGTKLVAAGSSDWIVVAGPDGAYPADEAYFLTHILHFVEQELLRYDGISAVQVQRWIAQRYEQLRSGELVYIAHQLDLAGKMPT